MSEVVTAPVSLPGEGQDITEISQRMSIREFVDFFQDNLPQPFRVDTASNQRYGELRKGNLLEACMVKTVRVIKARKPDSGKIVIIPKNSAITFTLLPEGTDEVNLLGTSWEGTFTVAQMLSLTLLPLAAKVLSECKDHDKKKVSKGTILYNMTTFTTKVLKKRGVKGVSSFRVVHKFVDGEDVQFSTSQLDTKCNLAEIYDIFKGPLRARVFCEGGTQLHHNDVVVFEEKEERKFLVAKTLNCQEPSSSVLSIPTDLTGVQVTAVRIKGYTSELLVKQKTLLRRWSSSKIIQDEGNQYVDFPIRTDVRDEPPPPGFEDHEYESVRRLSSETARSVSMESLESDTYKEMKVSYYNVPPQPSHTTDYPNRTRRHSEDIREVLYYPRPRYSVTDTTGTPTQSSRRFSDSAYRYALPPRDGRVLGETNRGSDFEEPEYERVRRLSSETARSVSMESLESDTYKEMKVSYYNVPPQPFHTTDSPNKTRRRSEFIKEALYYSRPRFPMTDTTGTPTQSSRRFSDSAYRYALPPRDGRVLGETNRGSSAPPRFSRKFSDSAYDYVDVTISPTRTNRGLKETNRVSSSSEILSKGTARSLPQLRVPSLHLPTVQEQSSQLKTPDQNSPRSPTSKPQIKTKPHQTHSPQTVTHEQRHPPPAKPRQGKGPPAMPQVSLDELKSSKVLNRGTTCTSSPGGPRSPNRESEDDEYEIIGTGTKPPPKPPVKPKPQIGPPNDPRFKVTPTNLQLLHHVAGHTGYQWRLFCAFLELEESSLDEADHKGTSLEKKCYEALLLWLQGEGKEPKWWTTILQALRKSDLTRVALDIQHHIMSGTPDEPGHEAELEKLCWIPFSIQSLTIRQKGGLFPLQPQSRELSEDHDVIMLEVPENAVNTAVCDRLCIRYGVIIYGPFDVPEGYQLGSMAVYIYFEEDHAVKPVLLHLPHWAGKDGESSLKCAIAPHRLEEGEEKYKFRLTEDGDFHSTEGSGVIAIDGHCSLYAKAFRQGASLLYYATGLEREIEERTILEVVVTFASQVWLQILKKNGVSSSKQCHTLFEFGESPIKGILSSTQGKGWSASMRGRSTVPREYVEYKSHGIEDAKDMERAVMNRSYPPFLSCQTTYSKEVKRTGRPTTVGLVIRGAKDGADLIFPCTTYEDRSAEGDREHPFQITPPPSPAINGDSNGCFHNPTSHNFDLNALTEHVVRHVAADWYRLGLYLGVEARVLDTVLADRSRDSSKACITMLGKWLNGAPGTGCKQREWSTILEAVGEAIGTEVQRFISNNLNPIMTSQQRAE